MRDATAVQRVDGGARFWLHGEASLLTPPDATFEWRPQAEVRVLETVPVDGGVLSRLEVPGNGAYTLAVRVGRGTTLTALVFHPPTDALTTRFAALAATDRDAATQALRQTPDDEWPWACLGVARAEAVEERAQAYLTCAEGAEARGFETEGVARRLAALHWARRLQQKTLATRLEEAVSRRLEANPHPGFASELHYQQGVALAEAGRWREARDSLEKAIDEALLVGRASTAEGYRGNLAVVLSESGRHLEALRLASALESAALSPASRRVVRNNVAWVRLRALAAGVGDVEVPALRHELTALSGEAEAAGEGLDASNYATNLAWLELSLGDTEAADAALARARTLAGGVRTADTLFLDWLEGSLALLRGDGRAAARHFEAMLRVDPLEAERAPDVSWRAQLGLAQALLLQAKAGAAEAALARARQALSAQTRALSEPRERVSFLDDRRQTIARAVDAFARAGRCELAFRLADDAQAWLARSLEADRRVRLAQLTPDARAAFEAEEERWATDREVLLSDAPPALASVEALSVWHARRSEALSALQRRATTLAARLDAQAPLPKRPAFDARALPDDAAVLELFDSHLGSQAFLVRRRGPVRCAATTDALTGDGALKGVRRLGVVDGRGTLTAAQRLALLRRGTLVFAPGAAWLQAGEAATGTGALVVGDPRLDLPQARQEARAVAARLDGTLLEGDGATLEALLSSWSGRAVLHFAGHGRLSPGAPWEARLELARGQSLDFEMLLARRPGPGLVVLSGCDTARPLDAPADGLGLAEGFLAGGTKHVLATTAEVDDAQARAFVGRFYEAGGAETPAEAFRQAALAAEATGDASWADWRLVGAL